MGLQRLDIVSVPVSDQDRAKQFYMDKLGFTLVDDQPMGPDRRWVRLAPPGGGVTITLATWFPTMTPGSIKGMVLNCDDVDETAAELTARGMELHHDAVQQAPWGRWVSFDDIDGNGWVVQENRPQEIRS